MYLNKLSYKKVKNKYLKFLKSQEVLTEPFRDKVEQLNNFFLPMGKMIHNGYLKNKKTQIIGLTGAQGSGKSTISNILKIILKESFRLETVILSIDDFYKTLKQRENMSKNISPLFMTRGVPGTHDTKILLNTIKALKKNRFKKILIPQFNKGFDDRAPKDKWLRVNKKPNIVIFEGWCVGAEPQKKKDLLVPVNALEKHEDKKKFGEIELIKNLKKITKRYLNY